MPSRQLLPQKRQQSKIGAENNQLNKSGNSDGAVAEEGAHVKHLKVDPQPQERQKREIEGALVTEIVIRPSADSSQQQGRQSELDATKLPCTGTTSAPERTRQPEAEKHMKHENGTESNHQEEQQSNPVFNRKDSSVEGNMISLMMKLATIRNLYRVLLSWLPFQGDLDWLLHMQNCKVLFRGMCLQRPSIQAL